MQPRRPGIGVEARVLEEPDEGIAVAAHIDAQAIRRAGQELAQLSRGNLVTAIQDDDVLADRLDVGEEVARQNHVAARGLGNRPHEVEHLLAAARVQSRRRLVEDVQLRVVDHCLGELDLLLHARRVLRDLAVPLLIDADELQDVVRAAHRRVSIEAADPPHVRDEPDPGHVRDEAVVLRHVPDPLPHRDAVLDVPPEDLRRPRRGPHQAEQEPEERRLARTVRADEADGAVRDLDG